jgi:hypothetical protein
MVPRPQISTFKPSPNFTDPVTQPSSSEKASLEPVMWLLAPESRYHLYSTLPPTHPRWTWARDSYRWMACGAFPYSAAATSSTSTSCSTQNITIRKVGSLLSTCTRCASTFFFFRFLHSFGPVASLPTAPTSVGVELLFLLHRSLATALVVAAAARGAFPGLLLLHPGHPLLYQQLPQSPLCSCPPPTSAQSCPQW